MNVFETIMKRLRKPLSLDSFVKAIMAYQSITL